MSKKRGRYIVIEGIDGAGKTTQFNQLLAHMHNAHGVREPGGTPMGERIRTILKDHEVPRSGLTNAFLVSGARTELIDTIIRPIIESGIDVVADRNWLSTYAYQSAEGVSTDHIKQLSRVATQEFFEPDLLILLDVSPEVSRQRRTGRGGAEADYFDSKGQDYFIRVRQAYIDGVAQLKNGTVLNADGTPEEIWDRIEPLLKERNIL